MLGISFYILLGIISGLLAGMLGIGGGVIIVPGLAFIFKYLNMPPAAIMHMATSTSLACIVLTTGMAVITQQKQKTIDWSIFLPMAPGIILGTIGGTLLATFLPGQFLKTIFGIFLIFIAVLLFLKNPQPIATDLSQEKIPNKWLLLSSGIVIGFLSGTLGVGGGVFAVPIFLHLGLTAHRAMATSSACAFLLSLVGTLSFIMIGLSLHFSKLPKDSTGYIYWPAVFSIALVSLIFVPLGTKLAHRLPAKTLKNVFAVFLLLVALDMVL